MPQRFTSPETLVDAIIERVGKRIVFGLPLGLGKACHIVNALFARAAADPTISLTILTALTLDKPRANSELSARFLEQLGPQFFGGYPQLSYVDALTEMSLPSNIRVRNFFLQPGRWIRNPQVQQDYVSLNYTQVADYLVRAGVNVIAQLVAAPEASKQNQPAEHYSLSCNPDLTPDLMDRRKAGQLDCLFVGQVNSHLPYMGAAAERPASDFDMLLDAPACDFPLFMPPHEPVSMADHAIGLHVARLIPDGGTLQIGIGAIGDAIAHALILRQQHNQIFRELLAALVAAPEPGLDQQGIFQEGLYGLSEMLVEGFLDLITAGVLQRRVDNILLHAGFFIGSPLFYRKLDQLSPDTRSAIAMMPVSFINQIRGKEDIKAQQRVNARFVNSALMCTLIGGVVSDTLENGQVISGVGGQYNFIAQAFALEGARSVITLRATRTHRGKTDSNLRWSYGQLTVPRHLRDIVVTEYGIADLRDKSDAEVIAAMLNICDSRFQESLLRKAKEAGKIAANYRIPVQYRSNLPAKLRAALAPFDAAGHIGAFPLGSDYSQVEQKLVVALELLKEQAGSGHGLFTVWRGGLGRHKEQGTRECLQRMGLDDPKTLRSRFYRTLLAGALKAAEG